MRRDPATIQNVQDTSTLAEGSLNRTDPAVAKKRLIEGLRGLFQPQAEAILAFLEKHDGVVVPSMSGIGKSRNLVPLLEDAGKRLGFNVAVVDGDEFSGSEIDEYEEGIRCSFEEGAENTDRSKLLILDESRMTEEELQGVISFLAREEISLISLVIRYSKEAREEAAREFAVTAEEAGLSYAAYPLPNIQLPEAMAAEFLRSQLVNEDVIGLFVHPDNVALRNIRLFWQLAVAPQNEEILKDFASLKDHFERDGQYMFASMLGGTSEALARALVNAGIPGDLVESWLSSSEDYC